MGACRKRRTCGESAVEHRVEIGRFCQHLTKQGFAGRAAVHIGMVERVDPMFQAKFDNVATFFDGRAPRGQVSHPLYNARNRQSITREKEVWNKHDVLLHWIGLQIQQEAGMVGRPKPAMRRRLRRVKRANARCDIPCVVWVGEKSRIYAV